MPNILDGASSAFVIYAPDTTTKQWAQVQSTKVGNIQALDVNVVGTTGQLGSSNAAQTRIAGAQTSAQLLAANPARLGAMFFNDQTAGGGASLYLSFGTVASLTNYAVRVSPNTLFTLPIDFTGVIYGIWDAGGGTGQFGAVAVTEFS